MSKAVGALTDAELAGLLSAAVSKNASNGVTGMLLYLGQPDIKAHGGRFIQVLEGETEPVRKTFERIQIYNRHFELTEFFFHPTTKRNFPDWSMGYKCLDPAAVPADVNAWFDPGTPESKKFPGQKLNIPLTYLKSFYQIHGSV